LGEDALLGLVGRKWAEGANEVSMRHATVGVGVEQTKQTLPLLLPLTRGRANTQILDR
jgi:hypothetical protein